MSDEGFGFGEKHVSKMFAKILRSALVQPFNKIMKPFTKELKLMSKAHIKVEKRSLRKALLETGVRGTAGYRAKKAIRGGMVKFGTKIKQKAAGVPSMMDALKGLRTKKARPALKGLFGAAAITGFKLLVGIGKGFKKGAKGIKMFGKGMKSMAKVPTSIFGGLLKFAESMGVLEPILDVINALIEMFVGQVMVALMPVFQMLIDQLTSPTMLGLIKMLASVFAAVLVPALAVVAAILDTVMIFLEPLLPYMEAFSDMINSLIGPFAALVKSGAIAVIKAIIIGILYFIGGIAYGIAWIIDTITFLLSWIPGIEATHMTDAVAGTFTPMIQNVASFAGGGAYMGVEPLASIIHGNEMVIDIDEAKQMVTEGAGSAVQFGRIEDGIERMNDSLDYLVYQKKIRRRR